MTDFSKTLMVLLLAVLAVMFIAVTMGKAIDRSIAQQDAVVTQHKLFLKGL